MLVLVGIVHRRLEFECIITVLMGSQNFEFFISKVNRIPHSPSENTPEFGFSQGEDFVDALIETKRKLSIQIMQLRKEISENSRKTSYLMKCFLAFNSYLRPTSNLFN
jgi:hypothetical protein